MKHRIDSHAGSRPRLLVVFSALAAAALLLGLIAAGCSAATASTAPRAPRPAPIPHPAPVAAAEEELEEEVEWEWSEEEDEEEEIEVEYEFEEEEPRAAASGGSLSTVCALIGTTARVVASNAHDRLRLSLHPSDPSSTPVTVHYKLSGRRGSMRLEPLTRHTSPDGTIGETVHPNERQMSKVRAARSLVLHLDVAGAPSSCRRWSTRRLTARSRNGAHTVWVEEPRAQRRR